MPATTERLEARVSREQKKLFQRAAELRGVTLTNFLIGALQDAASRVIEEHAAMKLTIQEQKIFVDALMNPPAPNPALRKASERHRRLVQ
jgi:uncharacterized protein (DUF1778 family)